MTKNISDPFASDEETNEVAIPKKKEYVMDAPQSTFENAPDEEVIEMETSDIEFVNGGPYPFINKEGDLKLGVAITMKESSSDDIFSSESSEESMLIINSETGDSIMEEKSFSPESLNKESKAISQEVFDNLANARKTTTLTKAYKN